MSMTEQHFFVIWLVVVVTGVARLAQIVLIVRLIARSASSTIRVSSSGSVGAESIDEATFSIPACHKMTTEIIVTITHHSTKHSALLHCSD